MAAQHSFRLLVAGVSPRPRPGRSWLLPAVMAAVAVSCLAAGLELLWQHHRASEPSQLRAAAGLLLIALAGCQLTMAWFAWRRRGTCSPGVQHAGELQRSRFWRRLFIGAVVSYVAGLWIGADLDARYFFQASLAGWYTAALWAHLASTHSRRPSRPSRSGRLAQPLDRMAFAAALTLVAAESSLRVAEWLTELRLPALCAARSLQLPPGTEFRGRAVNRLGYWDDEFEPAPRPGTFRVAVLGDGMPLSGTAQTNCLVQLERRVPGLEVYNFGIPRAGPREFAAQLTADVVRFRPDLVLAFFSVDENVVGQVPPPGLFDWRGLRLAQFGSLWRVAPAPLASAPVLPETELDDYEAYLRLMARRVAVCRTPIDTEIEQRWRAALADLADLARQCHQRRLPLALVLVPSEFQVSALLCETLRRRVGCEPSQLDLELPQRRLASFANQHELPIIDLLPHFRGCDQSPFGRHNPAPNDRGHDLAGRVIGSWLTARYGTLMASASHSLAGGGEALAEHRP